MRAIDEFDGPEGVTFIGNGRDQNVARDEARDRVEALIKAGVAFWIRAGDHRTRSGGKADDALGERDAAAEKRFLGRAGGRCNIQFVAAGRDEHTATGFRVYEFVAQFDDELCRLIVVPDAVELVNTFKGDDHTIIYAHVPGGLVLWRDRRGNSSFFKSRWGRRDLGGRDPGRRRLGL